MPGAVLHELHRVVAASGSGQDEFIGTLVNAWLGERGGAAWAVQAGGQSYVDVGTLNGYREAMRLLGGQAAAPSPSHAAAEKRTGSARLEENTVCARPNGRPRRIREPRCEALGPWFHNMRAARRADRARSTSWATIPAIKWQRFQRQPARRPDRQAPYSTSAATPGSTAMEMKRRGADRVLGIDFDEDYLAIRRASRQRSQGLDIEFKRRCRCTTWAQIGEKFDLVFFIGVLYHLRHPLLALDLIHEHVAGDLLVFQSLQRGSNAVLPLAEDYEFWETGIFDDSGYPKLHFIERSYSHDNTNWWAPNAACSAAMLRAAGFGIEANPEDEVFICRTAALPDARYGAVYPSRGKETRP